MKTTFHTAETLASFREALSPVQLEKKADLEAKGWGMLETQVLRSADRTRVAVPFSNGRMAGFLLPTGQFVLPPKGKTSVRLDANLNRVF